MKVENITFYLGLTFENSMGEWTWGGGAGVFSSSAWAVGSPRGGDCAVLTNGLIHSVECTEHHSVLCVSTGKYLVND